MLIEVNKTSSQLDQSQPQQQPQTDYSDLIKQLFKKNEANVPEVIQPLLTSSKNFNLNNLDPEQLKHLKVCAQENLILRILKNDFIELFCN